MATVLNFEAFRSELPRHWVDLQAGDGFPAPRGWVRDLAALAEVVFADETGPADAARVRWVCERTREYVDAVGGKARVVFRVGVAATSWIAPVLVGRMPPLRRLPYAARLEALRRYERSPFGLSLFAVKVFAGVSWFEHPEVARETGFDGRCRGAQR